MPVGDATYGVIVSDEAKRAVREIDPGEAKVLAEALRTLLDDPPGAGVVFPLPDLVSTYLRPGAEATEYYVLVTTTLYNAIFRKLTDVERQRQEVLQSRPLLDPTYFVVDVVRAD